MARNSFENVCVFHILDGLRDGLSHFSGPSRAALLYAPGPDDPMRIYDPQHLLRGHEPRLKEFYVDSQDWRAPCPETLTGDVEGFDAEHFRALQLAGLVSYGGRSAAVNYQMWFTEEHPDMCDLGPTRRWLEYAARLFSQNYEMQNVLTVDTAGYVLQQCANHAIRDHLVDARSARGSWDTHLRIYPILDAVISISKTPEEGAWPRGILACVEPALLANLVFIAKFPDMERPSLENHKHVRKLLQSVQGCDHVLVSDGRHIHGIATGNLPLNTVVAEFRGNYGFLRLDKELVCSFSDGRYQSSNRKANLVQLEEALLESSLGDAGQHALFRIVGSLVNSATEKKHGCTIVVDLGQKALHIPGQHLVSPLDLQLPALLEVAQCLTRVDGAVHLGRDRRLHGFACLLDGRAAPGENRARGARFNSALRFTAEHDQVIVVVVSSDRPVSILQNGVELTARCEWSQLSGCPVPPTLRDWLES